MRVIRKIKTIQSLIKELRQQKKKIGFVPTMGALHEGHLSLIRRCRRENDIVVLSIYVNPTQFAPGEDFDRYPRQEKKDKLLSRKEKVDIIFYPTDKEMYPDGYLTYVEVKKITECLCGLSRPGHFKGVTTVVAKLLNIVLPDVLYLGQKDAQQAVVLSQMVRDLNFPVKVRICPTVRESDGLAMSSRNSYLNPVQRQEAVALYASLRYAKQKVERGERDAGDIVRFVESYIRENTSADIDYVECVDADSLESLDVVSGRVMIALAVKFGNTRLIDNIIFKV